MMKTTRSMASDLLPPRALSLLDAQLASCQRFIESRLDKVLEATEQLLFDHASQSPNDAEQKEYLEAMDEVKQHRHVICQRFFDALPYRLEKFGDAIEVNASSQKAKPVDLSILTKVSQDEKVILDDLATRAETQASLTLFELGHRYAVLAGSPIMEIGAQPFSPTVLCEFFRQATADLSLQPAHKIILYRQFGEQVLKQIAGLYNDLNNKLAEQGILANLRMYALRRNKKAERHTYAQQSSDADATQPDADAPQQVADNTETNVAAANIADNQDSALNEQGEANQDPNELRFSALLQALNERRQATGDASATGDQQATAAQAPVQPEDIDRSLKRLQRRPATIRDADGQQQPRSMQQLREEMFESLQQGKDDGQELQLTPVQADTMELTSMLFDYLSEDINTSSGKYLLSELQAPLLRIAMGDQRFFTDQHHAARNWLEKVAEASSYWGSDTDQDSQAADLIHRIHGMNRTINRDFDGDPAILDGMAHDLQQQLEQMEHRANMTERRHVEAARGREQLTLARQQAEALLEKRAESWAVSGVIHTLLKRAWTDVLTLNLLRQGKKSDEFRRNLKVVDALGRDKLDLSDVEKARLRKYIEKAFQISGMDEAESNLLAREATGAISKDKSGMVKDKLVRQEMQQRLVQHQEAEANSDDKIAMLPDDIAQHDGFSDAKDRIKNLGFGTWFEFDDPSFDSPVQRKMAWHSPMSGRCLFVNRRGMRTYDTSIDHLAGLMVTGQARLAPPVKKTSFIDRALDSIWSGLKKLGGRSVQLQGQPA